MIEFLNTVIAYSALIIPWFITGIIISYFLNIYINHDFLKKLSGYADYNKIIFAQFLGMISPLSILSFLPIANELTNWGVNPGLLLSFFIAERAYDLQSFFIISGLFGLKFAVLNAIAIFLSLLVSAISVRNSKVKFKKGNKEKTNHFWQRQTKMMLIVLTGIFLGSLIRNLVPSQLITGFAGGYTNSIITAIILGFSLYLGPIIGNYPVAKAFSELGMSNVGTFTFLTISPILNFIVILLFGASVGYKTVLKPVLIYVLSALLITFIFSFFL